VYSEETDQKAKIRAERQQPTDVLNVKEEPSPSEGPIQKRPAKKHVEEGKISSKDNDIFGIRERTTGEKTGKGIPEIRYFIFQKSLSTILWTSRKLTTPALHKAFKFYDDF
jgi:hypothetical protein